MYGILGWLRAEMREYVKPPQLLDTKADACESTVDASE